MSTYPYLRIGPHKFSVLPMSYQKLKTEAGAHVTSIGRFGAQDAEQTVGFPSPRLVIDGLLFPKELGGKSQFDAIRGSLGQALMMVGFADSTGRVFGRVVIERVSDTQEHIAEDGSGKMLTFSIEIKGTGGTLGQPGGMLGGLF